jgi:hypothetical protein
MNFRGLCRLLEVRGAFLVVTLLAASRPGFSAVSYSTDFRLEKKVYLVGEPVLCDFIIQNTGSEAFAFPYRAPTRALNPELGSEPRFVLTDSHGQPLADPAPHPCGGARGRAVYGSVTLPPGQISVEVWVLNQWGEIASPGVYHVHAIRHLPLYAAQGQPGALVGRPAAYALAVEDLSFRVARGTAAQLEAADQPLTEALLHPRDPRFAEAVVAVTSVPHAFLEPELISLLGRKFAGYPWVREQALEGLARLGTRPAWDAILDVALGRIGVSGPQSEAMALREYAILLLAEKRDRRFVSPLLGLLQHAPEPLQEDVLPALGFFHDPRANRALFQRLHSPKPDDRVNAILGLKNLNNKDAIPALLAMLHDPNEEVRRVADFALESLTGQKIELPPLASPAQLATTFADWNTWWQDNNARFSPNPQHACRDW